MKFKFNMFALSLLTVITGSTWAMDAPVCPPLSGYTIYDTTDRFGSWDAFFSGPGILDGGFVTTTANNYYDANAMAKYAMSHIIPVGNAEKVFWGDGSWFWACSNLNGNYPLSASISRVFLSSKDYSGGTSFAIKNQHSAQEKYNRMLESFRNAS